MALNPANVPPARIPPRGGGGGGGHMLLLEVEMQVQVNRKCSFLCCFYTDTGNSTTSSGMKRKISSCQYMEALLGLRPQCGEGGFRACSTLVESCWSGAILSSHNL